jgi:hypothetical protein
MTMPIPVLNVCMRPMPNASAEKRRLVDEEERPDHHPALRDLRDGSRGPGRDIVAD